MGRIKIPGFSNVPRGGFPWPPVKSCATSAYKISERETAYFLTSSDLRNYEVDAATVESEGPYIIFALTDESLIDTMPDADPVASPEPDILIRDLDGGTQFLIRFPELKKFQIDRPSDHPVARTYTIPMPEALVEELPSAVRALLQMGFYSEGENGLVLRDTK